MREDELTSINRRDFLLPATKLLQILNSGDEKKLCTLHGIGNVRARQIIKFHEEHGDFCKIDDLRRVLPKQFVAKFVEV